MKTLLYHTKTACLYFILFLFSIPFFGQEDCPNVSFSIQAIPNSCNVNVTPLIPDGTYNLIEWKDQDDNILSSFSNVTISNGNTGQIDVEIVNEGEYFIIVDQTLICSITVDHPAVSHATSLTELNNLLPDYYWTFDNTGIVQFGNDDVSMSESLTNSNFSLTPLMAGDNGRAIHLDNNSLGSDYFTDGVVGHCLDNNIPSSGSLTQVTFSSESNPILLREELETNPHFAFEFLGKIDFENGDDAFGVLRHSSTNSANILFGLFLSDPDEIDFGVNHINNGGNNVFGL